MSPGDWAMASLAALVILYIGARLVFAAYFVSKREDQRKQR